MDMNYGRFLEMVNLLRNDRISIYLYSFDQNVKLKNVIRESYRIDSQDALQSISVWIEYLEARQDYVEMEEITDVSKLEIIRPVVRNLYSISMIPSHIRLMRENYSYYIETIKKIHEFEVDYRGEPWWSEVKYLLNFADYEYIDE